MDGKGWACLLFFLLLLKAFLLQADEKAQYLIGQGVADITGPAGEVPMMGYASLLQKTHGIHTRLWARAFVISDLKHEKRVALVTADLGMIFQAVKREVVKSLQEQLGTAFNDKNVMLTATHTHSGPGGYSEHSLYNFTIGGFDEPGFKIIVDGITEAIATAYLRLKPGVIKIAKGDLKGASTNRSPQVYDANPLAERLRYDANVDEEMLLLRFEDATGRELGLLNWFAVHNTSISKKHTLIASDNKGLAAFLFERSKGTRYENLYDNPFVAAFSQGSAGDVSPNNFGPDGSFGRLEDDFEGLQRSAEKQLKFAKKLYEEANTSLSGPIDYQQVYSSFKEMDLGEHKTCVPALGWSFAAGAEDGPTDIPGLWEGMVWNGPWLSERDRCHAEKPIIAYIGYEGFFSTPEIVPVQLIRIGDLAIAGVPFEVTTMAGRRMKNTVQNVLSSVGVKFVTLAAYTNAYIGYLTTREEYARQHYEGASNHFGPWSLAATELKLSQLANAMVNRTVVDDEATPPDLSHRVMPLFLPIILDLPPFFFIGMGDLSIDAKGRYRAGEIVKVSFWGGHPNNSLKRLKSFVEVVNADTGEAIAHDWDPEVIYRWDRFGVASSHITITWHIPEDLPFGRYYVMHRGHASNFGSIYPYEGHSRIFWVF